MCQRFKIPAPDQTQQRSDISAREFDRDAAALATDAPNVQILFKGPDFKDIEDMMANGAAVLYQ
jgi:hypothetical protein